MATPSLTTRSVALDLVSSVLKRHRPLDETLEGHSGFTALEPRERAFARNLSATTLRRLGQIDDIIGHCLERPLPRRAVAVRDVLRLGICQLFFLNIPAHAAVDTTVSLLDTIDLSPYKKLVNAIMRRLTREGEKFTRAQDAARLNTPDWLWDSWQRTYGKATGRKIAEAHLNEPPLDITLKGDPDIWVKSLQGEILPTGSLRLATGGIVTTLAGFDEGAWWVQDTAATLPALLLGDVKGKHVIDLCAAPGGKTAQLLARGARVTAVERSAKRLQRLQQNMTRLGFSAETVCADANVWKPDEQVDAVLLDAPCSATGTIRRHPDISYLKKQSDVDSLSDAQYRLLEAALEMVKPGGRLVFCTCSLQPEEGPQLIEKILAGQSSFKLDPIMAEDVSGLSELITGAGVLRSLPNHLSEHGGMDGFFAARLVRG
ncbi:MAG: methyltransferase domain-containing protein [Rhodospirillaceae bacterium]|jgi:16S rRNA (cytosine967-C5)-methyltransferase|nr:methyltransferase domain-containing protein [Rhodospirillaceae bacterium]MBT5244521.1 methyltransferase domain-containing protein [Rhodospirillaceae bacterium]MBT5560778.1 methyltransferase domain-containing protein [Rhodospirillaceae bacterium]MBT6241617.1 methyltransferase domain-containing protein [Rhodospirillaceae bacterium]MBT7138419.1 methyltransferase domain-containing protein [Rhodospirillaceae bacterium]